MADMLFKPDEIPSLPINTEAMHEVLAAQLGERFGGISTSRDGVTFHLSSNEETDRATLLAVMQAHDPKQLSKLQLQRKAVTDAYQRFISIDFTTLKGVESRPLLLAVVDALADIQLLMRAKNGE